MCGGGFLPSRKGLLQMGQVSVGLRAAFGIRGSSAVGGLR